MDHKDIGLLYIWTAFIFFILGGLWAMMVRWELWAPGENIPMGLGGQENYNQYFTTHALTMIFLWVMPVLAGLGNYFVPLMIGAKDMAFPRVNALSFWLIPIGATLLYVGFPSTGWTMYAPLTGPGKIPGHSVDYTFLGLHVLGLASTMGSINFLVTIFRMRAPGVTFHNMPLFVWSIMTMSFLLVLSLPVLAAGLTFVLMDRNLGTHFFDVSGGGDPVFWQHVFWFFGHPEVYVLILPAMGIVSEVIPKFSRRHIFGYHAMAYAIAGIGVLGFVVWAHHMFTTGIDPRVRLAFMLTTMAISVPTGVKIFNWIATMWNGRVSLKTPMLFAVGFVALFTIGGINGVYMASIPVDYMLHDTYWSIAHIHYVLVGGSIMGIYAGLYFWLPKWTGRMYHERLGVWHWLLTFIGINLTFFIQHFLGLAGMPRSTWDYAPEYQTMNQVSTIGAFILGAAQLLFIWNVFSSWLLKRGIPVRGDPWVPAGDRSYEKKMGIPDVWDPHIGVPGMGHGFHTEAEPRPAEAEPPRSPARTAELPGGK